MSKDQTLNLFILKIKKFSQRFDKRKTFSCDYDSLNNYMDVDMKGF
jgi:hypothetical protein